MRTLAALALVAALGAAAPTTVTVVPTNLTFKQLRAACAGSLAGLSFSLGHLRVADQSGVTADLNDTGNGMTTLVLTGSKGSATVKANAHANTIAAKNVKLSGKSVACVSAD